MRWTSDNTTLPMSKPQKTEPRITTHEILSTSMGPTCVPATNASVIRKAAAAVPSLNRLSASIKCLKRPVTPASLKVAKMETGSVAAIKVPKRSALIHSQCNRKCIPAAVTPADRSTPRTANVWITAKSLRTWPHRM